MRIVVIDESASRASIIPEGLAQLEGSEVFVLTERKGLVAQIDEASPAPAVGGSCGGITSFAPSLAS